VAVADAASTLQSAKDSTRLDTVDVVRGLVMVVMAIDHVRDYFSFARFDPTDLSQTTVPLFFTRWITHFCAPVFVFLAGTGSFLSLARGQPKKALARFLLTRGIWLVILEVTILRFGWSFDVTQPFVGVQVIWAIGWSMIVLSALVFLPVRVVAAIGITMVLAHNALDRIDVSDVGSLGPLWRILHVQGPQPIGKLTLFIVYPLVPWIGVMACGYAFGEILVTDRAKRRRRAARLGFALIGCFIALRASNLYGDPAPWGPQKNAIFTVMSFLNCTKYPPSLLYLLMTLGPALVALSAFDRQTISDGLMRPIVTFGRVPMFYYLIHVFVIHLTAVVIGSIRYGHFEQRLLLGPFGGNYPDGYGYGLFVVYLVWLAIVLALYPVCAWFAGVKRRRKDAWLRFL
jgi:uncharacterized membrane protein